MTIGAALVCLFAIKLPPKTHWVTRSPLVVVNVKEITVLVVFHSNCAGWGKDESRKCSERMTRIYIAGYVADKGDRCYRVI